MPAGPVADQQGMSARCDLRADLRQVRLHRFGIRPGGNHPDTALRADGIEQVGGGVAVIAHDQRPRADQRPDVGISSFLTNSVFISKPYFCRCTDCSINTCLEYQAEEFA